ncbi:chromosome segregation SMC family protein [Capillimicrobium parvum]|uniref:Chromosome partition protein Smc n=1 Tax=Capillimicrobium parvum TaxID=2884022 RepID=A0A9E6XXE1_9ACTN|nr:AAA family ATPase [Capillimicrobium parvum]UGS35843.1 Chromosome partition protein Smc [Capillimicrobium parvum]
MHLKSLTLKGFKSFPDRTRLEFGSGVSVIVGPNGSGKSNVTDAVLWALGEQSPLAVRGASMQDVIFGGGRGVQARNAAEVELVLDNGEGSELYPMSEISIQRRLDRSGDGEYRLNGARCRLVDVLEVLSDTGLGKEMHSVVSQGRIEAIVTSKPRDRRLLIEEAAGLGKHRKRRRRAQLKLERTQDNLDRALDVEREARSRLRPLKRQAEAAELHERLERQSLEARWELARDVVRSKRADLGEAEAAAVAARAAREEAERRLTDVAARRERAEEALQRRTEQREAMAGRVYAARTARDRVDSRLERAAETASTLAERVERRAVQIAALESEAAADAPDEAGRERIAQLEAELERLDREHEAELERELETLEAERAAAEQRAAGLQQVVAERREALKAADAAAEAVRRERRESEKAVEAARRAAAKVGAELAAANQFLRSHAGAPGGARALSGELQVDEGYELALAAALDGRLGAAVVEDLPAGAALLDRAGRDGGRALVLGDTTDAGGARSPGAVSAAAPPPGAVALASLVRGPEAARALLDAVWVVEDLATLPEDFAGVAVTRTGRAWSALTRELRQVAAGGAERVLAERNRRDRLIADSERAVQAEQAALAAAEGASTAVAAADAERDEADQAARQADRERSAAGEEMRRAGWLIEQRRKAPQEGAAAVRRAQAEGELAAERRTAERAARERAERGRRLEYLRAQRTADEQLEPLARTLAATLGRVSAAVANRVEAVEAELAADREAGEGVAAELRACAREEAEIQNQLRQRGDALTTAEVRAQQLRDAEAEASHELGELAERLGLEAEPATEALEPEQADALRARIERLAKRREQLGPVNPLAKDEYAEAVAHVEELETQREDLETALRELRQLIRDTDREIRETFEATFTAAAQNFEELAEHVFPGGRGRLRLVREDAGPRAVLGGQGPQDGAEPASEEAAEAAAEAEDEPTPEEDLLGVEIEITPAGKSTKRLTLLSGGEKSMTAIAFLFAVFLAKPCPFYILDEVEAALDDLNLERFLALLERYADRAQFIVVTHQKKTMDAADCLYGVSMGGDGVSKVVSRRLPGRAAAATAA